MYILYLVLNSLIHLVFVLVILKKIEKNLIGLVVFHLRGRANKESGIMKFHNFPIFRIAEMEIETLAISDIIDHKFPFCLILFDKGCQHSGWCLQLVIYFLLFALLLFFIVVYFLLYLIQYILREGFFWQIFLLIQIVIFIKILLVLLKCPHEKLLHVIPYVLRVIWKSFELKYRQLILKILEFF